MTLAALRNTRQIDGTAVPTVYEPVCATDILYNGGMAALTPAGLAAPAASVVNMSAVLGRIERTIDNTAGGTPTVRILAGQFQWDNTGTSIATANIGQICYATDDEAVQLANNAAGTLPIAGCITAVDANGVTVQTLFTEAELAGAVSAAPTSSPIYHVRSGVVANVANLAAFPVANDGVAGGLLEGDRVLLPTQAAQDENGIYDVGVVAAGNAPLTRSLDFDDGSEIVNGAVVAVAEGTVYEDTAWAVTSDSPIVVGTDNVVFQEAAFGYGAVGVMVAETIGQAANAGVQHSASRSDHVHAMPAAAVVVDTGEVNVVGAAGTFADSAHVHAEHSHEVRFVMTTDVPNLAAFVITQDGVVGVQGDLVLLANQTAALEAGVYEIGAVAGTAPLVRVAWLPVGAIVTGGYTVHVNEGTIFANTSWFIAEAGQITINTTAHTWYPETATVSAVLVAGTVTDATIPVLSLTKTNVICTRQIANTANLTVGGYHATVAGNTGLTAGVVGTCAVVIEATVGAGTINNADISTLHVTVLNR